MNGTTRTASGSGPTALSHKFDEHGLMRQREASIDEALQACIADWSFEPVVGALQALRGLAAITASGLVAEIGDLGRFAHPRKLMGYLGLVPPEHSSGQRASRGSITKTGNAHARRLLT